MPEGSDLSEEGSRGPEDGSARPEVLFVCVHNAGRSQMAAVFLEHISQGRIAVRSAGSAPAEEIDPVVVEAMREVGIDLRASGAKPKRLEAGDVQASDVVITMGCGDACPVYPGKRYEDWAVDDPAGKTLQEVRVIRDEIERKVRVLARELLAGKHSEPCSDE